MLIVTCSKGILVLLLYDTNLPGVEHMCYQHSFAFPFTYSVDGAKLHYVDQFKGLGVITGLMIDVSKPNKIVDFVIIEQTKQFTGKRISVLLYT